MADNGLQHLLRLAVEASALERQAFGQAAPRPLTAVAHISLRPVRLRISAAILAAAASIAFWFMPRAGVSAPPIVPVVYAGAHAETSDTCVQPQVPEDGLLLAVLRVWDSACDCMTWRVHRWDDGQLTTPACADDVVDIPVALADDPPIEQFVVLAVSDDVDPLASAEEADQLLACLRATPVSEWTRGGPLDHAQAVASCLPVGVRVVPQSFSAD